MQIRLPMLAARWPLGSLSAQAVFSGSLAFAILLGMGCMNMNWNEPSGPVSSLSLEVITGEWEPGRRHLMLIAESGWGSVTTETNEGCWDPPCRVSADVRVTSTNPSVVSVSAGQEWGEDRGRVPLQLVAKAAGTATITAAVGTLSQSERVDVVEAELPLDDVRFTLTSGWNDLPTQYDAAQSLSWMQVPVEQTGALEITALRDGASVRGIPLTVASSASGVGLATLGCRPSSIDPSCDVYSDGWVTGVAEGDAQVTISARNITKQFTVHVVR